MTLPRTLIALLALAVAGAALTSAQDQPLAAGSDGVPVPKKKKFVQPVYPPEALAQGIRGIVILDLVIDTEGRVVETSIIRSIPGLDEAALVAARQWVYEPVVVDGKPVSVRLTVPITFALKLPEMTRDRGIPELRQGVTPPWPERTGGGGGGLAVADVTLEPDGRIGLARIIKGEEPWSTSLLQALRTWRFRAPPDDATVSFRVAAEFLPGRDKGRVALSLSGLREAQLLPERPETAELSSPEVEAPPATPPEPPGAKPGPEAETPGTEPDTAEAAGGAAVATAPEPAPEAEPQEAPEPETAVTPPREGPETAGPPAPEPPTDTAEARPEPAPPATPEPPPAPGAPEPQSPPATPAAERPPAPESPAPTTQAPQETGGETPEASATVAQAVPPPPVEVLSVAPPPLPPENGISAIRGVDLEPGVPDLTRGRRPVSPPLARMQGASGEVTVEFSVSGGGVTTVQRVEGPEILQPAARGAVESWFFRRTRADRAYLVATFTYEDDLASALVRPQQ